MRRDGAREPFEVIAALEQRDDAAAAAFARNLHQPARRPGEIGLDEIEAPERIEAVRVEARRNDEEVGAERLDARQDRGLERLAKGFAAVAGAQRRIDDLIMRAALASLARAGLERHLMRRGVHGARVVPENVLRAVAVMNIEIDHGDTLGAMNGLRMPGGDGRVVEEAKAHRRGAFGMMAGRPRGDKGVGHPPAHHLVHGESRAARGMHRRLQSSRRHQGVGVEASEAFAGRRLLDRRDIGLGVCARERFARGGGGLLARQHLKHLQLERLLDGAHTLGALGMAGAHFMAVARGVGEEKGRQREWIPATFETPAAGGEHRAIRAPSLQAVIADRFTFSWAAVRSRRTAI
jgi:hypothetical protein